MKLLQIWSSENSTKSKLETHLRKQYSKKHIRKHIRRNTFEFPFFISSTKNQTKGLRDSYFHKNDHKGQHFK